MDVSIIIPNHNRREALEKTLQALCDQTYPSNKFEVIVVDQVSTDGSKEYIRGLKTAYRLILIEQDAQYGASIARNAGISIASNPLLLFLDADIIIDRDNIEQHMYCHNDHPGAMICGLIRPYYTTNPTFIERSANPEPAPVNDEIPFALPYYLGFSGHFSISREVLDRIGSFNPQLLAIEDVEFAYRAYKANVEILCCPKAVGYHNHPRNLIDRLERARSYARFLPLLYERYPEWQETIPGYKDFNDINWFNESWRWVLKKVLVRMISRNPIRVLCLEICQALNSFPISERLARLMYWRLIQAYGYLGFLEGKKMLTQYKV